MKGIVTDNRLNVRDSAPNRAAKVVDRLKKGTEVDIVSVVYGEKMDGINAIWYKLRSGHFVWSKYVQTNETILPAKKKIIFTADDYGVVDSVNNGVITAVTKGKLNSVTCFTNYGKNGSGSLRNIEKLLKAAKLNDNGDLKNNLELGVHLTITSGSPLLGRDVVDLLCRPLYDKPAGYEQSDFLSYHHVVDHYEAKSDSQKRAFIGQLKAEMEAQLNVFKTAGIPINHITSHHNSLLFHPDFFAVMADLAVQFKTNIGGKEMPVPMRSLVNIPSWKDYLFLTLKSKTDFSPQLLHGHITRLGAMAEPRIQTPDMLHSDHYGPPPLIQKSGWPYKRLVSKKQEKSLEMINDLLARDVKNMEFLLHLRDGDIYPSQANYERDDTSPTGYAGIDPLAFDSRTAELASFLGVFSDEHELPDGVEMTSWKEIRTSQLKS